MPSSVKFYENENFLIPIQFKILPKISKIVNKQKNIKSKGNAVGKSSPKIGNKSNLPITLSRKNLQ